MSNSIEILDFRVRDQHFLGLSMSCCRCMKRSQLASNQVPVRRGVATVSCPSCLNEAKESFQSLMDSKKPFLIQGE
ncbi:hypothetical protein SAMN06264348_11026 [Oceanospirillum linum]|nr:hypothetical protein SAMN06264348_11026 [Oceanospirillum linum]